MKKQAAIIAICAALLICVAAAGCIQSSSSSPTASATAHSSSKAATASPIAKSKPTVTPIPSASSAGGPASLKVLFFYRSECPYCQALENTTSFQQLQSKATVQWIVSDKSPLTDQYGVTGVPTLILLNHGNQVGRWVDPADASAINAEINSLLAAG